MPTTDARGHKVPTGTDQARRQSLLDLSLSIPSIRTAKTQTEATQYVSALAASGVAVSPESPAFVNRTDLGVIMSWDGTSWLPVAPTMDFQTAGDSVPQVVPSGAGPNKVPRLKTGYFCSWPTEVVFGNAYMPVITFDRPFPGECTYVGVTPVYSQPLHSMSTLLPQIDTLDRTRFRVVFPEGVNALHAFLWLAVGY